MRMARVNCMDALQDLDTGLAIWQHADLSQWPLQVVQLKKKKSMGTEHIFPVDRNTKINADRTTVT